MIKLVADIELQDQWVERLCLGDIDAFEWLYNNHKRQLLANLLKLVKSPQVAEDILQDVFVKVWENRTEINPTLSFGGYLYRIASNMVIDFYRKSSRSNAYREYLLNFTEITYQHVDKLLEHKESKQLLESALNNLSPQAREVFQLCRVEGKSYQEVATLLQISTNTISTHLSRANKKMKLFLKNPANLPYLLLLFGLK